MNENIDNKNVVGGFSPKTNMNPLQLGNTGDVSGPESHFQEDSFTLRNKFAMMSDAQIAGRQKVADNIYFNGWDQIV